MFGGTGGPSSTLIASPDPNRVISAGASNSKINGYSDGSKFERTDAKRA